MYLAISQQQGFRDLFSTTMLCYQDFEWDLGYAKILGIIVAMA